MSELQLPHETQTPPLPRARFVRRFLFPINDMTIDQREALRQEVIRWIGSKEFDGYLKALHLDPMQMPLALLASVFHFGGVWPWGY